MKNNFIERSVMGALSFFKESIFAEEYALKDAFLQRISPQIKALIFVLFIISVLFARNVITLLIFYLICIALAYFSKIGLGFFLKRTWVFIPLFAFLIAVPALFSAFTPGRPIFSFNLLGVTFVISQQGLFGAIIFVLRVTTCVSFVILLGLVTKHTDLLRVLRILKIPQIYVLTMSMSYRYIYLFVEIVENTYMAIKSRSLNLYYDKGQKIVAWKIANLWQRSKQLNEEVYNAMLSRGYTGEPAVLEEFKTSFKDWLWLFFTAAVCFLVLFSCRQFT